MRDEQRTTSDPARGTGGPVVLRQTGAVLVPLAIWVVGVGAFVDAVLEGTAAYALQTAVVVAAVSLAAWVGLWSPRLEVLGDGLRVVNPLRVHEVPYAALEHVRVRGLVELTYTGAGERTRTVTSWNAPGMPRRRTSRPAAVDRGAPRATVPAVSASTTTVTRFQEAWERSGGPARDAGRTGTARWRTRELVALLVLVAAAFVIGLLP